MKYFKDKLLIFTIVIIFVFSLLPLNAFAEDNKKTIYLTFDDGPGAKITEQVLDILKEEEVHATFFLIGEQIKGQEDLVKRISDEGHSLGLHSMSHNKRKLYSSNENFLNEMLEDQKLINEVTGKSPNILRFPFGSNNNGYHLKKELVDLLHENNLKIYDWNVDSTDGANSQASPSTFIKNAKSDKDNIILLMHCGFQNKNSVKALPTIIKYYKDAGYEFKPIGEDTEELYHFMKK